MTPRDFYGGPDVKRTRKKKPARKVAEEYCNTWFSRYIKLRDKACVTCGSTASLQCSHLFPGRHSATEYRSDCAYAQCAACHAAFHRHSQLPLIRYAQIKWGVDLVDKLRVINHKTVKTTTQEYQERAGAYRSLVDSMEGEA